MTLLLVHWTDGTPFLINPDAIEHVSPVTESSALDPVPGHDWTVDRICNGWHKTLSATGAIYWWHWANRGCRITWRHGGSEVLLESITGLRQLQKENPL